jgi:hypothetical protein
MSDPRALCVLLAPYADPDTEWRLRDLAADVAAAALALAGPSMAKDRPGGQPPATWLVEQALALDGTLVGSLVPGRSLLRINGIQVPAPAGHRLLQRIASGWPATSDGPAALDTATAEAWTSWTGEWPTWIGTGTDLLAVGLPEDAQVVGLWWNPNADEATPDNPWKNH